MKELTNIFENDKNGVIDEQLQDEMDRQASMVSSDAITRVQNSGQRRVSSYGITPVSASKTMSINSRVTSCSSYPGDRCVTKLSSDAITPSPIIRGPEVSRNAITPVSLRNQMINDSNLNSDTINNNVRCVTKVSSNAITQVRNSGGPEVSSNAITPVSLRMQMVNDSSVSNDTLNQFDQSIIEINDNDATQVSLSVALKSDMIDVGGNDSDSSNDSYGTLWSKINATASHTVFHDSNDLWKAHNKNIKDKCELHEEINVSSSNETPTCLDTIPIIDLCSDNDSTSIHYQNINKKSPCKNPDKGQMFNDTVRRPRLFDLCMQKAHHDCVSGIAKDFEAEDEDDLILIRKPTDYSRCGWKMYRPPFLDEVMDSDRHIDDKNSDLLRRDWLTNDLVEEIENCFPHPTDIGGGGINKEMFKIKIERLFMKGREFASYKQLYQAAVMFQEAWNGKLHIESKHIKCFYGKSNKTRVNDVTTKKRVQKISLKN